jgi:hypothetical protein
VLDMLIESVLGVIIAVVIMAVWFSDDWQE